ncbi:MAG: hypothetical protein QM682_13085 [Paracoccus sp. (in: a-proteobacteria)]|uniref:hypothetical protein n=1 Tax=Paracoccus sp. TaxID=267 RepID=UPI0039E5750E
MTLPFDWPKVLSMLARRRVPLPAPDEIIAGLPGFVGASGALMAMTEFRIKRGATFHAELLMDDAEEWEAFAHDRLRAAVRQGARIHPVTVVADDVLQAVIFTAATDSWPPRPGGVRCLARPRRPPHPLALRGQHPAVRFRRSRRMRLVVYGPGRLPVMALPVTQSLAHAGTGARKVLD